MKNLIKTFLITPIFLLCFFAFPQDAAGLTFGYTAVGGSVTSFTANRPAVHKHTLPADGDATKMTIHVRDTSGTTNIKALIYDDSSTYPNVLKGTSQIVNVTTAYSWKDFTFSPAVSLVSGDHWIGSVAESTYMQMRYDSGDSNDKYISDPITGSYASPPNPYTPSKPVSDSRKYSIYCTYTAGGAERRMFLTQ